MNSKRTVRFRLAIAAFVVASLITGGFVLAASGAAIRTPEQAVRVSLPSLPPVWELEPEIYDKDGCLKMPPDEGGRKCGPSLEEAGKALPMPKGDDSSSTYRVLRGFAGPNFAPLINGTSVAVLPESVTVTNRGAWRGWGLVRNESTRSVGNVVVTATLLGSDGSLLEQASAQVPISPLRPGEPGPFTITATVAADQVSKVLWSVQAPEPAHLASRDIQIQRYWEEPYGIDTGGRMDPPYPYVLAAGIRNLGVPINGATLVVAWLDDQGRVVWVEKTPLASEFNSIIPRDGSANFTEIRVGDAKVGPRLLNLEKMYWAVGE